MTQGAPRTWPNTDPSSQAYWVSHSCIFRISVWTRQSAGFTQAVVHSTHQRLRRRASARIASPNASLSSSTDRLTLPVRRIHSGGCRIGITSGGCLTADRPCRHQFLACPSPKPHPAIKVGLTYLLRWCVARNFWIRGEPRDGCRAAEHAG